MKGASSRLILPVFILVVMMNIGMILVLVFKDSLFPEKSVFVMTNFRESIVDSSLEESVELLDVEAIDEE